MPFYRKYSKKKVKTALANVKTSITSKLASLKLKCTGKDNVQPPVNEEKTKQRRKFRKRIRSHRKMSFIPIINQSTVTDKHTFNIEKKKSIKPTKQAISYRATKEIGLPEVSS